MKDKKCRGCGDNFTPERSFQVVCNPVCAIEYTRNRSRTEKEKKARAKHREDKKRVKPHSKLLAETQAVVNRYVRLRDKDKGCVSCNKPASWDGQWHASHFHSRGKSSRLRFNLWNIHSSCSVCNNHLSGNLANYQPEIIRRIGQDKFDWMESVASEPRKYSPEYLERLKAVFSRKCSTKFWSAR